MDLKEDKVRGATALLNAHFLPKRVKGCQQGKVLALSNSEELLK